MTDAHGLYGLPLEQFVSARGALAKTLRGEGSREQAAHVAGLRKPSVAAWAVNQLVRTQTHAVAALFDAGDQLRQAESELLAGRGDAPTLRAAAEHEREAVDRLADAARGLLSSQGHELTQTTLDRVSETLHSAALDDDARAQVQDGCLVRELRHVGFGTNVAFGETAAAKPQPPKTAAPQTTVGGQAARKANADARRAARKAEADARRAAQRAEADARRAAERATRELQAAQEQRDRAAASLRDADDTLTAARERAEATALAHERARGAL